MAAAQLSEPIPQILNKVRQDAPAASVSALLSDLRDAAQSTHGGGARLLRRHASRNVFHCSISIFKPL